MNTLWILIFAFTLAGEADYMTEELMFFEKENTCKIIREMLISRVSGVLQLDPSYSAAGRFEISDCELRAKYKLTPPTTEIK